MLFSQWKKKRENSTAAAQTPVTTPKTFLRQSQISPDSDGPMLYSQWKKKQKPPQTTSGDITQTTGTSHSNTPMLFSQWKKQRDSQSTFKSTAAQWAKDSSALLEKIGSYATEWFDTETYNTQDSKLSDMLSQADTWRAQYAGNTDALDAINSVADALRTAKDSFQQAYQVRSQWNNAEAYQEALQDHQEELDLINYDTEAAQKEINALWDFYDNAYTVESWYTDFSTSAPESRIDPETDAHNLTIYNELVEKYGSLADLRALIQEKELYLIRSKRAKEKNTLVSVADPNSENYDPDFATGSAYVSTKHDGLSWDLLFNNDYALGYGDLTYEYINGGQNGMREKIEQAYDGWNLLNPIHSVDSEFEKKNYRFMNDDEIAIYNYYYSTEGKESAERYLDLIQETLNYRAASKNYARYEGNTFSEIAFGAKAGLDQFASGVKNFFNFSDDYIPVSETQMLSGMVREDLADDSIPIWYNFKTGEWEDQVFGNSAGQMAYDAVNTTANMLPTVLASTAANIIAPGSGGIVGAGLSGISAAGNAYQEMLNLGYDKGQARAYSTLVGASEAGLSYALSGITALGGELTDHAIRNTISGIDNAFARVAIKLGGNMLSEGIEEGLTELITPWFQNMTLKSNEKADWGQVFYSGLLGALTANLFEGTGIIKENVGYYKSGKNLLTAGISPEQVAELGKTLSNQDVYTLAQRVDENTGAYTVGRLLGEIGATLTDANKATIADALESRGVRGSDAKVITAAVSAVMNGAELNAQQAQMLEANDVLAQTVLDVVTSESDLIQKNQQYRQLTDAAKTGTLNTAPAQTPSTPTGVQQQLANLTDLSGLTGEQRQFLQRYQQQLQSTEALRSQVQSLQQRLAQRKAKGQSAGWLMPDQAREASLGRLLQRKESTLRSMESSPLFQQVVAKITANQIKPNTALENFEGSDRIAAGESRLAVRKPYEIKLSREEKKAIISRGSLEKNAVFATDTPSNKFATYVQKVPKEQGFYDVALHGRDTSVDFFDTAIDAYTLSHIIRNRPDYKKGQAVRLLSCCVGNTDNTGDCVAQIVANELGVIVKAPNDIIYISIGTNGIAEVSIGKRNQGKMITFYPRK